VDAGGVQMAAESTDAGVVPVGFVNAPVVI
jgi:hypothetical protein